MAKTSEAQIRANMKYDKENTIRVAFAINKKTEADILACLNEQTNKNGYIKELIREDMKRRKEISKKDIERKNP